MELTELFGTCVGYGTSYGVSYPAGPKPPPKGFCTGAGIPPSRPPSIPPPIPPSAGGATPPKPEPKLPSAPPTGPPVESLNPIGVGLGIGDIPPKAPLPRPNAGGCAPLGSNGFEPEVKPPNSVSNSAMITSL